MVGHEDQHPEVVGQHVGQLEPCAVVVHPLVAGLVGLLPEDGEPYGGVDDLGVFPVSAYGTELRV